jgi:hypothetical protein
MARIAWFDALSRIAVGRSDLFDATLERLAGDVIANTWLPERYGCAGDPQRNRTAHFFEYPSVVAIMVAELRYGIQLGLQSLTIAPSSEAPTSFHWAAGGGTSHELIVRYSQKAVTVIAPSLKGGLALREFVVHGMSARSIYFVDVAAVAGGSVGAKGHECEKQASCAGSAWTELHWARKRVLASNVGVLKFAAPTGGGCEVRVERWRRAMHVDEV